MTQIATQYTKMQELRAALMSTLTQGVYDNEVQFCKYVAMEHPTAVRTFARVPGTTEQDCWIDSTGKVVAIWNAQFQVGVAAFSNQFQCQQSVPELLAA